MNRLSIPMLAVALSLLTQEAHAQDKALDAKAMVGVYSRVYFDRSNKPVPTADLEFTADGKVLESGSQVAKWSVKGVTVVVVIDDEQFGTATLKAEVANRLVGINTHKNGNAFKWVLTRKQIEVAKKPKEVSPSEKPAWDHLNIGTAKAMDGFLRIEPKGKQVTFTDPSRRIITKESVSGPVEITVVAKTAKDNIRLHAFNGAMVIFNWELDPNKLVVHRPDGTPAKFASGSVAFVPFKPLAPNTWYTLRWRIQKDGMEVAVDDKVVFSEKRSNDLSTKQPIGLCALNSVVDVKSFGVKHIQDKVEVAQEPKEQPGKEENLVVKKGEIFHELGRLPVRPDTQGRIAMSPDGKLIASSGMGKDQRIYISELLTGKHLHALEGHTGEIRGVEFSPHSKSVFSGSMDGTVREWDMGTGREKRTVVEANLLSGVGITLNKKDDVTIAIIIPGKAAALDGRLKIGDRLTAVSGRDWKMVRVQDMPLEQILKLVSGEAGTSVKLEVVPIGEQTPRIYEIKRTPVLVLNQTLAVALSQDGSRLAVGCTHRTEKLTLALLVRILETSTGKELLAFQTGTPGLGALAFSPDGKLLATTGHGKLGSLGHNVTKVWDVVTGKELTELKGHKVVVCWAAFSPDGRTLATVGTDKSVKLWKVPSWEEKPGPDDQLLVDSTFLAPAVFSPDGRLLAVGGMGNVVQVWDANNGKKITAIKLPSGQGKGAIGSLAFAPDSSLLALSSSWDGRVHIWGSERPGSVAAQVAKEKANKPLFVVSALSEKS